MLDTYYESSVVIKKEKKTKQTNKFSILEQTLIVLGLLIDKRISVDKWNA